VAEETVWAAAAQDSRPRLLVVDEVWSIMQHPEGAAFMVSMAKRARKHRLGLQFITQDVQDLPSEDSSRTITSHSGLALLQNAAFKLLL
jgi:type IV secretory pathway VirB4 component